MQSNQNPLFQAPKKKPATTHQNFIEALKSIGGSTVQSVKRDLIQGTAQDAWNSVTGNYPTADNRFGNSAPGMGSYTPEWMQQREDEIRAQEKAKQRHKEFAEARPVFDRRQEEIKEQIQKVRDELKLLAREIGKLGSDIQRAIEEEIVNPGIYHVTYFEKMRSFLINLRKQVSDSQNWMAISSQRKQAKNVYWANFKKQGTKYSMSQERTLATSAG